MDRENGFYMKYLRKPNKQAIQKKKKIDINVLTASFHIICRDITP